MVRRYRSACRCSMCSSTRMALPIANGAPLPTRFGTYFWGLGLTDTPSWRNALGAEAGWRWLRAHAGASSRWPR